MISGQRFEQHTIAPFSVETGSDGRPCVFHAAISASSERDDRVRVLADIGIGCAAGGRARSRQPDASEQRDAVAEGLGERPDVRDERRREQHVADEQLAGRLEVRMPFAQRTFSEPSALT